MIDELEPDEDELTDYEASMAFIFGDEPDYKEWAAMSGPVPLKKAICYALGFPLNPVERSEPSDCKEEAVKFWQGRAISDKLLGRLNLEPHGGEDWVLKEEFYTWIKQQDEELNRWFLKLEPVDNSFNDDRETEMPPKHLGITEKRENDLKKVIESMIKEGAFSPRDPRWPRTKIWERAIEEYPSLFPSDPNDQREGVFAKAYNKVKKYFT